MKKLLAIITLLALVITMLASCTDKTPDESTPDPSSSSGNTENPTVKTPGESVLDYFKIFVSENEYASAYDIAYGMLKNEYLRGGFCVADSLESGSYIPGIKNSDTITFKDAARFGPMMNAIALAGYVFEVEDGTDVDVFMQTLKNNADPAWNVCVSADEVIVGNSGNMVMLFMCPSDIEPQEIPDYNKVLADNFELYADSFSGESALTIAQYLIEDRSFPIGLMATSVEAGPLSGFEGNVDGFKEAARFSPFIGSIPFMGYIFVLEDNSDADAFVANLKNISNPRWNICTQADVTLTAVEGNYVFFLMAPENYD